MEKVSDDNDTYTNLFTMQTKQCPQKRRAIVEKIRPKCKEKNATVTFDEWVSKKKINGTVLECSQ